MQRILLTCLAVSALACNDISEKLSPTSINITVEGPAASSVHFADWERTAIGFRGKMTYTGPILARTLGSASSYVEPSRIEYTAYAGTVKTGEGIVEHPSISKGEAVEATMTVGDTSRLTRVVIVVDFVSAEERAALDQMNSLARVQEKPLTSPTNPLEAAHQLGEAADELGKKIATDAGGRAAETANPPGLEQQKVEALPIWSGMDGPFSVTWSRADISASNDGKQLLSLSAIASKEAREFDDASEYTRTFGLLSVVGPVLSVSDKMYCDCGGAHPIGEGRISAFALDRSGQTAQLTDYFSEADILRALLNDGVVKGAIAAQGSGSITALKDLFGLSITTKDCTFAISDDLLTRFAFHHLEGGSVAVRLALSHGIEACRGATLQLGMLLPVPDRLRQALDAANAGTAGFLMKDSSRLGKGANTELVWKAPKS